MSKKLSKLTHVSAIVCSLLVIFILGPYLFYTVSYMGKIYPNIYISGINVGGMTTTDATTYLERNMSDSYAISLISNSKQFELLTNEIGLDYNHKESINRAFNLTRSDNFLLDVFVRTSLIFNQKNLGSITTIDDLKLNTLISDISNATSVNPIYPSIEIDNNNIAINKGQAGTLVDITKLRYMIGKQISLNQKETIIIPSKYINPTLNDEDAYKLRTRAEKYLGKKLIFKFETRDYSFDDNLIVKLIDPNGGLNELEINTQINKISESVNREPQIPKFVFDGTKVTEFSPSLDGILIDNTIFKELILSNLEKLLVEDETSITSEIPVVIIAPPVTTAEVNNLGIKELIGRGTSTYFHSIPGRVFNVNLAASKINGALVAPGETFSFNKILGDVSKSSGYKEAYVILSGRTVLGDGGGICQVSTTLFRAVMNAGLQIEDRSAHAYRVGYYEQGSPPGMDATVYYPTTDFKFINDTNNHVLIQAKNDPVNYSLVFELYGTKDARKVFVSKPVVSNYSPPLPPVYQDEPTLPIGTLKQVDYEASGARVSFDYIVTKDGEEAYKKTFISNYRPWANVFLRGTKTQ